MKQYLDLEKQSLQLRLFELDQLKKMIQMIEDEGWDNIDFQLLLKNPNHISIQKLKFRDCLSDDIIDALQKVIKVGLKKAIKQKQEQIEKIKSI